LGIYLGVELLGQIESLFLLLKELPNCFPKWLYHLTFSPEEHKCSTLVKNNTCYCLTF
jgi:hypothetical protein